MRKGNIIKGTLLGLAICGSFFASTYNYQTSTDLNIYPRNNIQVYASSDEVILQDTNLKSAICRNLGKNINDKLYSDDFLNASAYNPDPNTSKIERRCIDLSNSNIKDIKELLQFELPATLVAIDLSGNKLNNEDITKINNLLSLTLTDSKYIFDPNPSNNSDQDIIEIPIRTDWNTQILKVNLNNNNINLSSLTQSELNNTKFIYGIQNLNLHTSGMNLYDEVKDIKYYFKSSDHVYLGTTYSYHGVGGINPTFKDNQISPLIPANAVGEYQITINNAGNSETGYFYNMPSFQKSFKVFTAEIESTFSVERKNLLSLRPENIIINGLLGDTDLNIKDASTNSIGMQDVNIVVTNGNDTRAVTLKFLVKDTVIPTISLSPNNTNIIYWRQNKEFIDPGYKGYDSGDDITHLVQVDTSGLDITTLGTYSITYNLTDLAGNHALEVTRMVIIQEQVLDEVNLRISTDKVIVGREIIITAEPNKNIDITKYSNFEYTWYLNGKAFRSTQGDASTGRSTTVITLDNTNEVDITVELHAKQNLDNADVYVTSDKLIIKAELADNNTTIIIAMMIALGIIVIVFVGTTIHKKRKSRRTHQKSKSTSAKSNHNANIQVIKDYPDDKNKR